MRKILCSLFLIMSLGGITSCSEEKAPLSNFYIMLARVPPGTPGAYTSEVVAILALFPDGRFFYKRVNDEKGQFLGFGSYAEGAYKVVGEGKSGAAFGLITFTSVGGQESIGGEWRLPSAGQMVILSKDRTKSYNFHEFEGFQLSTSGEGANK